MTSRSTRTFSDLDLNFTAHPVTKDITRKFDENAVRTSLRNLILTNHYERPFQSNLGSSLKSLLFEPFTPLTEATIRRVITDLIINYEPRVELLNVIVRASEDNNSIYVSIEFKIINTVRPLELEVTLKRTR